MRAAPKLLADVGTLGGSSLSHKVATSWAKGCRVATLYRGWRVSGALPLPVFFVATTVHSAYGEADADRR
jgi:hypothetical protein